MKNQAVHFCCLLLGLVLILWGCTGTSPPYGGNTGAVHRAVADPEVITTSLFDPKDKTLSEESIQRLLNGKIILPDTIRIAVYKYGSGSVRRYYSNWWLDEEYLKIQQQYIDTLVSKIRSSSRIKKITLMPSMMISGNPSLTELREATVRLQADMLLIFSISSDIYYKYKMFKEDEAKAFATTEAILMDIRTGVIPHSSIVTREKFIKKSSSDLTVEELRKRAEIEAVILSLIETGGKTAVFLNDK
jgi:hypothetical protein